MLRDRFVGTVDAVLLVKRQALQVPHSGLSNDKTTEVVKRSLVDLTQNNPIQTHRMLHFPGYR